MLVSSRGYEAVEATRCAEAARRYGGDRSAGRSRVDEYRELLEVTFAAPSDVHQLIVFAYVQLLEWKPGQVVDELAGETLEDLGNRFVVEYTSQ